VVSTLSWKGLGSGKDEHGETWRAGRQCDANSASVARLLNRLQDMRRPVSAACATMIGYKMALHCAKIAHTKHLRALR